VFRTFHPDFNPFGTKQCFNFGFRAEQDIEKTMNDDLSNMNLSKEEKEALPLLIEEPDSPDCLALRQAAYRKAREMDGNRAYVWGGIGVDARPCPESCDFCSLGEAWHLTPQKEQVLSTDEVCERAGFLSEQGAATIALRTTQHFGAERLAKLAEAVKSVIRPEIRLACNTGECTRAEIERLRRAGFSVSYHVVRLREGIDTRMSPEKREETLRAVNDAGMEVAFMVEPIGPEHTAREIVERARLARQYHAVVIGGMARVPVKGTPLYPLGAISDARLACVCAFTRLCDSSAKLVCAHPPSVDVLRSGANVIVVEVASNPRDIPAVAANTFRGFSFPEARALMSDAGLSFSNEYYRSQT